MYTHSKYATKPDDFNKDVLRRTFHTFYDNVQLPTSEKILAALHEKNNYKGSNLSIKIILQNFNFKYKTCNNLRKF